MTHINCPRKGKGDRWKRSSPFPEADFRSDEFFNFSCVEFKYAKFLSTYGREKVRYLRGEEWDGSDFIRNRWGNNVSGRFAQWLAENKYGPVVLTPYPVDVSDCNEEQLKAIQGIRYSPTAK